MVHSLEKKILMFFSWFGQRKTKGCYFLLSITIIIISYFKRIRMIGQMDGLGNDQI
jgi:hypothetical protein